MANLRGSIGPNGYSPPANVTVKWRRPGAPDISKKLNPSVRFTSAGDSSVYARYGESDPEVIGRQITAIGSEQLGGRAFLILKELYAQAGLSRVPSTVGQEVWDFAIAEGGDRPMDWCDYKRFTGKPDPICGENCPPCGKPGPSGGPSGGVVAPPTNLRLEGKTLSWDWAGDGKVNFVAYTKEGETFAALGNSKNSPIVLQKRPGDGTLILLYAQQSGKRASEAQLVVGTGIPPIDPPVDPPIDPPKPPVIEIRGEIQVVVDGKVQQTYRLVKT
ncbi:MAG TPA: hypothetical protein VF179_15780 [Thermoanaerobaculia bacterium]|nr:hypothetical protein [Thermoanaerobaculia bacterium]